jgi:hypothetical protein
MGCDGNVGVVVGGGPGISRKIDATLVFLVSGEKVVLYSIIMF